MERREKDFSKSELFLWSDLPQPDQSLRELAPRLRSPQDRLRAWCDHGYTIFEEVARHEPIDLFLADAHAAISVPDTNVKMTYWDTDGHHFEKAQQQHIGKTEAKILDLHVHLESSYDLIFAPAILDFLTDIFQDEVLAFQNLFFEYGSQQGCHQDTAFVYVEPPYQFAASWIALEDIVENSGELFFYPGSQHLDDLIFSGGTKALPGGDPDAPHYSQTLERLAAEAGLSRELLHIKKGDALIWAADLIHGGAPILARHTRRSLVTHYCPVGASVPYVAHTGREIRKVRDRGWIVGAN